MIAPWPHALLSKSWWPWMHFVETWLSKIWDRCFTDMSVRHTASTLRGYWSFTNCNLGWSNIFSYLSFTSVDYRTPKTSSCSFKPSYPVFMGTCPFSPCSPPFLHSPHPLPAISRANLKLRYYESCTWCVGGRFRTSTPSINPPMGPTSWLNRPVPLPDNLSSDEAKLRSCNYTQTFLLSVAPLAKNLFWWLFDSPFQLLPWSSDGSTHNSLFTKGFTIVFFLSLHMRIIEHLQTAMVQGSLWFLLTDGFVSVRKGVAVCFVRCFWL